MMKTVLAIAFGFAGISVNAFSAKTPQRQSSLGAPQVNGAPPVTPQPQPGLGELGRPKTSHLEPFTGGTMAQNRYEPVDIDDAWGNTAVNHHVALSSKPTFLAANTRSANPESKEVPGRAARPGCGGGNLYESAWKQVNIDDPWSNVSRN